MNLATRGVSFGLILGLMLLTACGFTPPQMDAPDGSWLVVRTSPDTVATPGTRRFEAIPRLEVRVMSPDEANRLRNTPGVVSVTRDAQVSIPRVIESGPTVSRPRPQPQVTPTGIRRCGADRSHTAAIDGRDRLLDVDIAILDTGIDFRHPDLRVAGGYSALPGGIGDSHGHGTHVAGIAAAIDNSQGVVGVAPGARLWSVRIAGSSGVAKWSDVLDGLDWVARQNGRIEVANLSLSGALDDPTPLQLAVDRCVELGTAIVCAAGNLGADASLVYPAALRNVITVAGLADSNGSDGPSAGRFRVRRNYFEFDESFADFSNHGSLVHLAAPAVSILSTSRGGRYKTLTGTSQAAPHVAGALALLRAAQPAAATDQAISRLMETAAPFTASDLPVGTQLRVLQAAGY